MIFKANIKFMNSETNRIEYKQELTDDLEKEAVAFLNYPEGGVLYIGIEKTGTAIGVIDIDSDMLKIKDRLKNNITPSCMGLFDIATENIDSRNVIKITFASGPEKPYYIKIGLPLTRLFLPRPRNPACWPKRSDITVPLPETSWIRTTP